MRIAVTNLIYLSCIFAIGLGFTAQTYGQGTAPGGTPQVPDTQPQQPVDNTTQQPNIGGQDDGEVNLDDAASLDFGGDDEDNRNQGFIGNTSTRVGVQGFVGAGSVVGPQLSNQDDVIASYGGEFEGFSGENSRSAVVPTPNRNGFQTATPLGSTVIRQNVRARLRPSFFSPSIAPARVQDQFVSVVSRQPVAQSLIGRFSIRVQNKTAYIQGTVNNSREASYIERQLRLQPGVYRIVNQLQVLQPQRP